RTLPTVNQLSDPPSGRRALKPLSSTRTCGRAGAVSWSARSLTVGRVEVSLGTEGLVARAALVDGAVTPVEAVVASVWDSLMRSKVSAAGPALMPGSSAMVTHPSSTVNVPGASGHVDSWSSQCSPTTLSQPKGFASAEFRESRQVFHSVTNWFTSNTPCCRCCGHRVAVAGSPSPARTTESDADAPSGTKPSALQTTAKDRLGNCAIRPLYPTWPPRPRPTSVTSSAPPPARITPWTPRPHAWSRPASPASTNRRPGPCRPGPVTTSSVTEHSSPGSIPPPPPRRCPGSGCSDPTRTPPPSSSNPVPNTPPRACARSASRSTAVRC